MARSALDNLIEGSWPESLAFQNAFESTVAFLFSRCLKEWVWLKRLSFTNAAKRLSFTNAAKRLSFTKPWSPSDGSSKHYIGCTETEFKTRHYNHSHSIRHREKRNATVLSKAFWNAKDSGHEPSIKWSIANRATAYQPGSWSCNLCLTEKLAILLADKRTALNKRSELTGKCRHKNKYKLKNFRA